MPNKKKLYEALKSEGYDNFADESAFNSYVDNPDNRKKLFDALKSEGYDNFADEKSFDEYLGYSEPQSKVQQYILGNKPDMFKPKTVDMYGAHDKDRSEFDLMNEGKLYQMKAMRAASTIGEQLDERIKSNDEALKSAYAKREADSQNQAPKFVFGAGSSVAPKVNVDQDDEEIKNLLAEQDYLGNAKNVFEAAKNDSGFLQGMKDAVNSSWLTFGVSDLHNAERIAGVQQKLDSGEPLSDSEQSLLTSLGLQQMVNEQYNDLLGRWYKAGMVTAEMAPFMAEMAVNPLSGLGKSAMKWTVKKFGEKGAKAIAAKVLSRTIGDVTGAAGMAATTGMPGVSADASDRQRGYVTTELGDKGTIKGVGFEGGENASDAWRKAFTARAIENWSEMVGEYFSPVGKAVGKGFTKAFDKMGLSKVNDFIDNINSSEWVKLLDDFSERTQWNGPLGEFAEEQVGMIANAALVGDTKWSDITDLDKQLDVALGVGVFGTAMSLLRIGGYRTPKYRARKAVEGADKEGAKLYGEELWETVKFSIDNSSDEELGNVLATMIAATGANQEQAEAAFKYANALKAQQAVNTVKEKAKIDMPGDMEVEAEAAYDEGSELETPLEKHEAKRTVDRAERALGVGSENSDEQQFAQMVMNGVDSPVETVNAMAEQGYTEEQIQKAKDYYTAVHRMNGLTDALLDKVDSQIESANAEVDANTNKDNGSVTKVILRDGREGYVVEGSVVRGEEGRVDVNNSDDTVMVRLQNGEVKMMNPNKDIYAVAWIDSPEQVKEEINVVLREDLINQAIGEIDWNPATPNPKVGDSFEINGVPVVVAGMNENGLIVVLAEEWQKAQGKKDYAFQSQYSVPVSEYKNWASAQLDAQQDAQAMAQEEAETVTNGNGLKPVAEGTASGEELSPVEEKRPMTEDEAASFIFQMERNAVEAPEIELTPENWIAEFGEDGLVETPIGQVKFGQGQYVKLQQMGRRGKLGMIKPTLTEPDVIIEDKRPSKDGSHERDFSYVFIKAFTGKDGKRMYYFTSVTIKKGGSEVVISNQEKSLNKISRLLQGGNVVWTNSLFSSHPTTRIEESVPLNDSNKRTSTDNQSAWLGINSSELSTNKDSDKNVQSQENKAKPFYEREKEEVFRELGEMYGEKMPHKVEVTAKAWADKVKKAQKKVDEAQQKLDDAPIGEDAKQKAARDKAKTELEAIRKEADFWAGMDEIIKQGERMSEEASAEEIAAVLSEEADNYEQSISETENGQESTNDASEGSDSVLPEEQSDDTDGTETDNGPEGVGEGIDEEGEGAYADEQDSEVEPSQSRILDVFNEASRIAAKHRKEQIKARVKMWEAAGVKVKVHERISGIRNMEAKRAIMSGEIVAGWYDGEAHVYLPHIDSLSELDRTILHEAVSHMGIKELMGKENFDKLCDKVWEMMPESVQKRLLAYEGVKNIDDEVKQKRAAADEYMAHLAEDENLSPEENSLWQKIVQWFKDLFTAKVDEKEQAVSILNQSRLTNKDISELLKLSYANLKSNAVERIEENVGEVDTEKSDVRFAVRDVLKGEEREQAIKDLMAVTGRSKRTVVKWLKAEESLASVILNEDNVGILDMEADESVPSIWKNSDYPQGTVEFSNICKKRLPFTTIYQRLQKEFPDTLFDAQTLNTIRNTMKEMGEDVACALCFVEDRRQLLGEIGQGFIDAVKGMDVELNDNQKVALDKLRESGDKYVPNLFDIITLDGMKELRKKHPAVAQAFIEYNNARGMQSGRLFQAYSAYNREILKYNKKKVESINNNGGLRIFSFSDFEAHHLIDLVQVLTDCAAKGIKVQGYTKVPEFAKAVKDTNAKINRSLIPKGVGYVDADYVPKEGEAVSPNVINGKRLLFDTIEGIDVNNPNFFDSTGSKSVGNILVAINDEHARLAMADPFVDYIIGFHTGQSKAILKGKGIDTWVNYKNEQLDKEIVTDEKGNQKMKNAPHHGLNIYTDVLNVAEAEGNPIKTAKQFTERFIEECNKRGWIPRFHRFLNRAKDGRFLYTPGYHKFLIDFKLFDKNGKILPQEAVVPVFDNEFNKQILDEYVKGVKEEMPNDAVYEAVKDAIGLGEGTRFRFIGEQGAANLDKAEEATTRLDNLNVAREMEAAKKDAKAIKMATGWERGADGLWRYETEDVKLKGFEWINQKKALKLQDIVDDNELFTAYPILSEIKIKKGRGYSGGSYSNEKKELELKLGEIREDIKYFGKVTSYNEKYFKETVIHEIQHAIQDIEGFASGGSSSTIIDPQVWNEINRLTAEVDEIYAEWDRMPDSEKKITNPVAKRMNDEVGAKRKEIDRLFKDGAIGYEGYKKLSGEVEARNAATRMNMSEEERRLTLASETEDVAREDQIFLRNNIGISEMGSRVRNRMKQVGRYFEGRILTSNQQSIVDVFCGNANNKPISVVRPDGTTNKVVMRQGTEDKGGSKHSLLRHFDTHSGVYTEEEILLIEEVLSSGEETNSTRRGVDTTEYNLVVNGVEYTVVTETNNRGAEVFDNFYTNRSDNARSSNTQLSAQADSTIASADKDTANSSDMQEGRTSFRVVTDKNLIDKLESEPKIKVYRAMQLIDGKLYPPMSAKVDGKMREPIELGKWEMAEERPDLADEKGYFKLDKGNKSSLKARYNPYIHTSTTPLNDQFSSAQSRPELVTVEVEIPESELTSGYKAEKAKDAVGKVEWKAGVVQGKLSGTRTVILSRYDKPIRIVPDSEVADEIVKMFDGKDITMPSNVVTPSLRAELEKLGVPFVETDNQGKAVGTRFRVTPEHKQHQMDIINETNPAPESNYTWIRSVEDINSFEEALDNSDYADYKGEDFDPSYTWDMVEDALETGKVTVYSSYPIKNGVFVTPSYMEAQSYGGTTPYMAKVNLEDVAWIDPTQGQLATENKVTSRKAPRGVRFRISEKGKQIQAEVDKFAAKYNSKPVVLVDSEMTDEELEAAVPGESAEDLREALKNENCMGGYLPETDKIYIFVDNQPTDDVEGTMFHENVHGMFHDNVIVDAFDKASDGAFKAAREEIAKLYTEKHRAEELFAYVVQKAMNEDDFKHIEKYLAGDYKETFYNKIKEFGYDTEEEIGRRAVGRRTGSDNQEVRTSRSEEQGASEEVVRKEESARKRKERLGKLFDQVADMGLEGVIGNAEYNRLMLDIFHAMPKDIHGEISVNAVKNLNLDVAKAVSDYLGANDNPPVWEKVVGMVRDALRKVGFDLELTPNDVKYMLWRSKKPLNRRQALDVAEDIAKRSELGVGEDSGTRFRTKKAVPFDPSDKRDKLVKSYDAFLKTGKFNFIEAFQDRMYSAKVLMDMIVDVTGKKVRDFEDAYTAENQLGSINKPEEERYLKDFYKPLVEVIRELSDKYGREVVERYIYCKSGLERNEVLRQRDADEAYNDAKAELDDKLAKGQLTQPQYDALLQQADDQRQKTLAEDVDYSGIRGMLYNVKAQAINKDYEENRIDKATRDARLAQLEANKKDEVKDWKQFAEDQVAALEAPGKASKAELDKLWKKINAATNETLRMDYESGMIDKETYDAEKNMMKYYVPLRNWADTTAEEMYEYRSELVRPVSSNQKRAKGRESQADNPIATIALMAQNAIVRGNRNKVKQKFYAFVANRETGLASVRDVWYEKDSATGDWTPKYADTSKAKDAAEFAQILDDFENSMKLLEEQGLAYKGKLPFGMKFRASRQQKMAHVVPVMINGKEYAVYVNGNPRPAQAINGETNSEAANASAWYDKIKRIYGAGLTSWNPDFIIPNMIRDGIHASTMTFLDAGPWAAIKFAANGPRAFGQVFAMVSGVKKHWVNPKYQAYFEEFVANGGETGYTAIHTLEDYKKEYDKLMKEVKGLKGKNLLKGGLEGAAKWLEAANRIFEDVNRFNAYVSARESGESIMRSVNAAKNITVNFNRKGALSANNTTFGIIANAMSKWILFFNPAVQGLAQLVTKTKVNKKRAAMMASTILASGFFMPMFNEALVAAAGDDEEDDYWNQSDFKRRNNWLFFTGDGYVSVPLPPVLRELYGIGDIIYGSITGRIPAERAVMDMARQIQSAIGFINLIPEVSQEPDAVTWAKGFAPDVAAPILDVLSNTNFMGRPIAKWTDFNKYDPEYERVYKGVSPQWVELSKLLNEMGGQEGRRSDLWGNFINPAMMEHLFTSYGGGIGKTINNLAGMVWDGIEGNTENLDPYRKSPIVPRFYIPNDEKTVVPGINRKYYDYDYKYNIAKKAYKNYQEGVRSKEHPEWQKYIDEMNSNGELRFIQFFEQEAKKVKKLQNLIKEEPKNKKELEEKLIDVKAEIAVKCYEMLK